MCLDAGTGTPTAAFLPTLVVELRAIDPETGRGTGSSTAGVLPTPVVELRAIDPETGRVLARVAMPVPASVVSGAAGMAPYLAEWIEVHLLAGAAPLLLLDRVEHFYLYNHRSADNSTLALLPYIERGVVDLHDWDLPGHPQKEAMLHCTHKYGHETR
ncbi:hypothetical protein T484DRAFT_1788778 [Baffinella frigidus]|nr:hypothetical protein T484DRAFT_1788778 [Cryptophyta sp. CCMP2293]